MTGGTFTGYARLYDAIYADKDYAAEADFVLGELARIGGRPAELLELGAGTGRHLLEFARRGTRAVGIDLSAEMVAIARERLAERWRIHGADGCEVHQGDIRTLALGRTFPAAASLFHVISYLTDAQDLSAALTAVRAHLPSGGGLLFDFWHLPGVLRDPPTARTRSFVHGGDAIERRMIPRWTAGDPVIGIDIEIDGTWDGAPVQVREQHRLRAWDRVSLTAALSSHGFAAERWGGGLADRPLDDGEWTGWVAARAV